MADSHEAGGTGPSLPAQDKKPTPPPRFGTEEVPHDLIVALAETWHDDDKRISQATGQRPTDWQLPAGFDRARIVERARKYMAKMPPAVSGQGGHDRTFHAAAVLVIRFGLQVDEALPVLEEWNTRCQPPWEEKDLRRKLNEVDKLPGPRGELLRPLERDAYRSRASIDRNGARPADTSDSVFINPDGTPGVDPSPPPAPQPVTPTDTGPIPTSFENYYERAREEGNRQVIERIGYPAEHLYRTLMRITGGWPGRIGKLLFAIENNRPLWLMRPSELFAWISRQLGGTGGNENPLRWSASGADKVSEQRFFDYLCQTAREYQAVELFPHEPLYPDHCYLNPPLPASDGTALCELLARFSPASAVDADLVLAFFLSLLWGCPAGQKPAWLFTADGGTLKGCGSGKSTIAQLGSLLVGGYVSLSAGDSIKDIQTRLLSPKALEARVALLDNVKSLRFSWAELESLITSPVISGKQMYIGEGARDNNLTWIITLNSASLSRDISQRVAIVKLKTPEYSATWYRDTVALIEARRWQIIADIVARLQGPARTDFNVGSRWGDWEATILGRVGDPRACQDELARRRGEADDDDEDMDLIRAAFQDFIVQGHSQANPETDRVFIPSVVASSLVNNATGDKRAKHRAMAYLYTLGLQEIKKCGFHGNRRGCWWTGPKFDPEADQATVWMVNDDGLFTAK